MNKSYISGITVLSKWKSSVAKIGDSWIFFLFFAGILFLYRETVQAGFVMDFIGWALVYSKGSAKDILTCFGYPGLLQVLHLVFYTLFKFFGTSGIPWFLTFTFLHTLNGFLLFKLAERIFKIFLLENARLIALLGTILFLISPYQAEVVVWKACMHYLLSGLLILWSFWHLISYFEKEKIKDLVAIHSLFIISLFTLEISLITPFLFLIFILFWSFSKEKSSLLKNILKIALPQFILIGFYFVLNKIILGEWVGHYGAESHLNFSVPLILGTGFKYFLKYIAFVRYFEHDDKEYLFSSLDQHWLVYIIAAGGLLWLLKDLIRFRRLSPNGRITRLMLIFFFVALAPVLNLYFVYLLHGENDRYGYIASMFFYLFVVHCLFFIPGKIKFVVYFLFAAISVFYLNQTTWFWYQSGNISRGLVEKFNWEDKKEVVILNLPDNYSGIFIFRSYGGVSGFKETYEVLSEKPLQAEIKEPLLFNLATPQDSVKVNVATDDTLTITFAQWGNWFWKNGIGGSSYENEHYKVSILNNAYQLIFKQKVPGRIIIYNAGDHWTEVKI